MAEKYGPYLLSVLRIVAALMFFEHGTQKLFGIPSGPPYTGFPDFSLLGIAGMLETFLGFLLIVGLFTRPISFVLSGEMAVAYFVGPHWSRSWNPMLNGGEITVVFCFLFLYQVAVGGGPWSLDRVLARRHPGSGPNA